MSEFDEIAKQVERDKREPNVGGNFSCFWCNERVSEAHYDYNSKLLEWFCKNDHRSYIEDFEI